MPFQENLSPQFQTLQGFHCMVPPDGCAHELGQLYRRACARGLDPHSAADKLAHRAVRVLDTFLSLHSEMSEVFRTVFAEALQRQARIQLLVLSPYAQLARTRAKAFARHDAGKSGDPLCECNESLNGLLDILAKSRDEPQSRSPVDRGADQRRLFQELLKQARKELGSIGAEIKFYDRVTDVPIYFISEFAVKGLLLDGSNARRNPWLVFVDDPTQTRDVYDKLSDNFDAMWDTAITHPRPYLLERTQHGSKKKRAFIAMPMSDDSGERSAFLEEINDTLKQVCESIGYEARRADEIELEARIIDIVTEAIDSCEFLVCDLTFERPNVYYEAGLGHALGKPVILIARKDAPIHFDVEGYRIVRYEDAAQLKRRLTPRLARLIDGGSLAPVK